LRVGHTQPPRGTRLGWGWDTSGLGVGHVRSLWGSLVEGVAIVDRA
jgi:hypothetical protein